MRKVISRREPQEMLPEYDFSVLKANAGVTSVNLLLVTRPHSDPRGANLYYKPAAFRAPQQRGVMPLRAGLLGGFSIVDISKCLYVCPLQSCGVARCAPNSRYLVAPLFRGACQPGRRFPESCRPATGTHLSGWFTP